MQLRGKVLRRSTHPRRLETDAFASFANSKLHGPSDDTTLGCALGFALAHEESAFWAEAVAALVADEASIVPLSANGGDDDVIQDGLLTAETTGCGAARVALETPGKAVFLDEGSL